MRRTCALVIFPLSLFAITSPALSITSARAQDQPLRLSEADFIDRYRGAEPRLRIRAADITAAGAGVASARTLLNPRLQYEREAVADDVENAAGIALSLDLGGRNPRVRSARLRVRAATLATAHASWELVVDALAAYYTAARDREHVALLESERIPLAQIVDLLRTRAAAGENAGYDRDRIELELLRYDERMDDVRSSYRLARMELGRLLGRDEVEPTGSLSASRPGDLTALITGTARKRPDWRAARAHVDAAADQAVAAGRWWVPSVALAGGLKTVAGGGDSRTGYFLSAAVEVPVFDRNRTARIRAAAAQKRARATMDYLDVAVPAAIRTAHARLSGSLNRLEQLDREQLPRAEKLVHRASLIYREGESGVAELTDAHRTVLEVKERRLKLQYRAKLAELELWRALGERPARTAEAGESRGGGR